MSPRPYGRKLWIFRFCAAVALPLVCLLLLELALRICGFGYPTGFLLSSTGPNGKTWVQNNQVGWRFFGRQLSRSPGAFSIPQQKPEKTIRVFVFGESAAFGDPQPRFGLPRMLEALLGLRYPGIHFEVVNAAMTGINSHAILPVARDCARANGDIWVLYMGNNEVVGPFGAGTVFGAQTPPLALVRANLAAKSTRLGQLLDVIRQRLQKSAAEKNAWAGMTMFVEHQVRPDAPQMQRVYHHFERNLSDIIAAGRQSGAGVVVSTVAVNLKDCAPFGSAHRAGLTEDESARWDAFYKAGGELQDKGKQDEATEQFRRAAQLDDEFAELRFRQGQASLALGNAAEAQQHFIAARDLDTLRFRCDSKLNDIIRGVAGERGSQGVLLADSERIFAEKSPNQIAGNQFFYEHVHLTFEGNYLLTRSIAERIEQLPEFQSATGPRETVSNAWPSSSDCAARLAWTDWNRHAALLEILARVSDPPFTGQYLHESEVAALNDSLRRLAPALSPAGLKAALDTTATAVSRAPQDPLLLAQLASLKQALNDFEGATIAAQRAVELLPSSSELWLQLGTLFALQNHFEPALAPFRRAFELEPDNVWALQYLAQALNRLDRRDEAIREYRHALAVQPRFGIAWLGLGQMLEGAGEKTEADSCYQNALANRVHRPDELALLARFCQSRGWWDAAATNYADALKLNPADAQLHLDHGLVLQRLGREADAGRAYAEAVQVAPEMVQAHFLYGLHLGRTGQTEAAVAQFREAVRIMPQLLEARLNLATALMQLGKKSEALEEFEQVISQSPTNVVALRAVQTLRANQGK